MDDRGRSPLRLLAPLALAFFGVIFLVILFTASGGESEAPTGGDSGDGRQLSGGGGETETEAAEESGPSRYTVEAGDTLDAIAEKTGVDVQELQALNPDLDPQALGPGQKIKLRE